jgi:dolichol-phosphate mannosyltransferase
MRNTQEPASLSKIMNPTNQDTRSIYEGHRVLAMFPFFNEASKIAQMAERLHDGIVDKFIGVNDGSTDDGASILRRRGLEVLDQPHKGVGACIKRAVKYAQDNGYDILVVMAGNNKDDPKEIPRLIEPIIRDGVDYVQGSRFLPGGSSPHLPLFRLVAIKLLSCLFRIYSQHGCTDLTNGFRAYRISLLSEPGINIWQDWLDGYEYEHYLHWKMYTGGYKIKEVPVTKAYPAPGTGVRYTKIQPITGWWQMLRPFVLLSLRIKK